MDKIRTNLSPDLLKEGDNVVIVSTARKVDKDEVFFAKQVLESWGLVVHLGDNLFLAEHQFAGNDAQRLSDLQQALNNKHYKAIFCARGGYGTPRIVDAINWEEFLRFPKWVVGFSDVTVLLNQIQGIGVCALHGPLTMFFGKEEYEPSIQFLKNFLFGEPTLWRAPKHDLNRNGIGQGILVGGNLSVIINSIGTNTDLDAKGTILFIEDIDEYLYHIDRMMLHLKRAEILKNLSGLIVGHFSAMKDNTVPFGESAYEIIAKHSAEYSYPVAFGFPVGHEPQNLALPIGKLCRLLVDKQATHLDFL